MPSSRKIFGSTGRKPKGGGLNDDWGYEEARKVAMASMEEDIKLWVETMIDMTNKTSFYWLATRYISQRLIKVMAYCLEEAAKRCPYDTGLLRESGMVTINESDIVAVVSKGTGATEEPSVEILQQWVKKPYATIEADISFDREVKGRDLALWAHEELLRYVRRPKSGAQIGKWFARKPGTGPKYLENAFKLVKREIPKQVEKGLQEAIREYNRKHGTRARRR